MNAKQPNTVAPQQLTEQHLMATLQTPDGPLPQAASYFYARFGGLT